jgi:chromosome segregation ATPase
MIHDFYGNTKAQISDIDKEVINYETKMEKLEEQHRVEIKVYTQKVKHLEYEHATNKVAMEAEDAQKNELRHHLETEKEARKTLELKKEYKEVDYAHINMVDQEKKQLGEKMSMLQGALDNRKQELIADYEEKLRRLRDELQLRLKVEVHEIEERKNQHINNLMKNHETAFRDMKDFYTDITRENIELIRIHQENLAEVSTNIENFQANVDHMKIENETKKGPLEAAVKRRDTLMKLTKGYDESKLSLANARARMKQLKNAVTDMKVKRQELYEKYERVSRQKEDMMLKFETASEQLRMKAEYKNNILDEKLSQHQDEHTRKEVQLHELIQRSGLNPATVDDITSKMKEAIEAKNSLLRNLKYSLAHATKAYNDAIRVYEAKLIEFGIPAEELGLELLETNTSTMPAGLVAA